MAPRAAMRYPLWVSLKAYDERSWMNGMRLTLLVIFLVIAAGCATSPAHRLDDANLGEVAPATPAEPVDEAPSNLWLLDGLRPVQNTRVSSGAEPSILADRDGEFIWIADTSGGYYSEDNGTSWRALDDFLLPSVLGDGWALAQDDTGRLYAAGLIGSTIDVATSDDGRTWASINRAAAVSGITDRPWLAAQEDGEVALFYYDYPLGEYCARSTDAGMTWLDRDPLAGAAQGGNAIFDDAGNFYYADDSGVARRFAGECRGSTQALTMFTSLGANNMIQLGTDGQTIYSAAATGGNKAIAVSGTKDFQRVTTRIVSPSILQSNTFATISVYGDQVAVAWYGSETPGDPSVNSFSGAFNVYVAIIDDFWGDAGIRHIRITDEPNHIGDICMGGIGCDGSADRDLLDYFMLDHDKWGGIHVAYGHDGAGSNAVVRYAQIPASVARPPIVETGEVDLPPVAEFSLTKNALSIRADASASSDPEGGSLSYVWSWGDGSPASQGVVASHTYDDYGVYTVTVSVTDAAGHTSEASSQVLVEEAARTNLLPVADFSVTTVFVGQEARFTDNSADADGTIEAWAWNFGDGARSNEPAPRHAYQSPGNKTVTLTVTDDWGESATASKTIFIKPLEAEVAPVDQTPPPTQGIPAPSAWVALLFVVLLLRRR